MLNRSASLAMSKSVLKALPGKVDIKRHSPSILYIQHIPFTLDGKTVMTWMIGNNDNLIRSKSHAKCAKRGFYLVRLTNTMEMLSRYIS